jgi:hypothetical protein
MAKSSKYRVEFPIPADVSEELTRTVINNLSVTENALTENISYRVENLSGLCRNLSSLIECDNTTGTLNIIESELNIIQALLYGVTDIQAGE